MFAVTGNDVWAYSAELHTDYTFAIKKIETRRIGVKLEMVTCDGKNEIISWNI